MWIPDSKAIFPDLLATSGDYLRVWRAGEPETRLECLLNNNKNSDFCAPLTSFDWNEVDPNLLGTINSHYNFLRGAKNGNILLKMLLARNIKFI